jgi:spermine oxidase
LNTKVTNIKINPKSGPKSVQVTVEGGGKIMADHVIFTASLGVLKKHHKTLFTPSLPESNIKAIKYSGFGTLVKIFLEFDKPFWPSDVNIFVSYDFLWTREDIKALRGTDREW